MADDSGRHHRRFLRLKGYDYADVGIYCVTICTQNRACLFGEVVDGEMRWNEAGQMIGKWWLELNQKFPMVETDEYVVMPNHFHGIIVIVGADLRVCPELDMDTENQGAHTGAPLHEVIRKSL